MRRSLVLKSHTTRDLLQEEVEREREREREREECCWLCWNTESIVQCYLKDIDCCDWLFSWFTKCGRGLWIPLSPSPCSKSCLMWVFRTRLRDFNNKQRQRKMFHFFVLSFPCYCQTLLTIWTCQWQNQAVLIPQRNISAAYVTNYW